MTTVADGDARAGARHDEVLDIVATRTLYDPSCLQPETHLEGELGVDPVIFTSIEAAIRDRFGLAHPLPPGIVTIGDLIEAVEQASPAPAGSRPAARRPASNEPDPARTETGPASTKTGPAGASLPATTAEEHVLVATMRHTRYRRDQLDLDAALESELGIDSVVLESILADVATALAVPPEQGRPAAAGTLRDLIAHFGRFAPATPDPGDASPATPEVSAPEVSAPEVSAPASKPWDDRSMRDFIGQREPDLFAKAARFAGYYKGRTDDQLYWYGMPLQSRCQNRAVIHDELTGRTREYLMFASNNYLGLANHPKVIEAICDATRVYGATNTGCRLIGGTNKLHKELEGRLAAFKQRPACIVYPSGYSANLGTISALAGSHDTVVVDKYNHMSIVDGVRLSGAQRRIYQHNDMADLEKALEHASGEGGTLIVADGVFSMHGDICHLPDIVRLARAYGARVLVDDAHATGVLGARGSGTAEHFGLKGEVDLELGTMSKALAGMGGFVVGDEDVIEYLRFYANSYVFAATIPAGLAAGLIAAIDVIEAEPERLGTLWANIRLLRGELQAAGFDLENSDSAVIPVVIGDERRTMELGRAVRARGLFCQTVVFPGVAVGDARLRISVTAEHTQDDLTEAAAIFADAARETGLPLQPTDALPPRPAVATTGRTPA
ncbi:MAG TPA: aminotransferase class I/II-fold pyridoxal phosphate-dependent enzyme [Streptosporangiaceae bacterium]